MATRDEVDTIWAVLVREYPYVQRETSAAALADRLTLYEQLLGDLPGDVLRAAALQHLGSSKWFPAISELREIAGSLMLAQRETAMDAWGSVLRAMRSSEYYIYPDRPPRVPEFANPITTRVVRAMGWRTLCMSENEMADRAHFIKAYDQMADRERNETMLLPEVREVRNRLQAERARLELGDGQPKPLGMIVGSLVGRTKP